MWIELFLFGSLWFWILIGVAGFWILSSVVRGSGTGATSCFIALAFVLFLFGNVNVFKWIYHYPLYFLVLASGYYAVGLCWAMFKWYLMIYKIKAGFLQAQKDYKSMLYPYSKDFAVFVNDRRANWTSSDIDENGYFDGKNIVSLAPPVSGNKATILFWMSYWPFGMLWFFTHDLFDKIGRMLVEYYKTVFQSISRRVLGSVNFIPEQTGEKK